LIHRRQLRSLRSLRPRSSSRFHAPRRSARKSSASADTCSIPSMRPRLKTAYLNATGKYPVRMDWLVADAVERNWSPSQ
jgi:hypothetical protein